MELFIVEAKEKDYDCYDSFVVIAKDKEEAEILALDYLDKEIEKWHLVDNFREYGFVVKKIDTDQARVIHTSFRSG